MPKKRRPPYEPRIAPPSPSRGELDQRFVDLVEGRSSREDTEQWAWQWIAADDPHVDDDVVWKWLDHLGMVGSLNPVGPGYFFSDGQLSDWLAEFRAECSETR